MFNTIYEEEAFFPYENMSLEEARNLRYLVSNFAAFANGELVQMSLQNKDGEITANGLVYEPGKNKTFYSNVIKGEGEVVFYSEITEIYGKTFVSRDEFTFCEKDIQVKSKIEGKRSVTKIIPYFEKEMQRK